MNLGRLSIFILFVMLQGCSPSPVEDAEIVAWFEQHHDMFMELKSLGEKHPRLHRIEPALSDYPHHHAELTADDKVAERRIVEILGEVNSDFVVYWRVKSSEAGELISISIPYYRWGLSLGGYYQSIEYVPNKETLAKLTSETSSYVELKHRGWYIHASDTR